MFGPSHLTAFGNAFDQTKIDKLDPMQNQLCRVCEEPAAGFHFGAFTCEGCKSFFGRTCNNQSVIQECKNNYHCVINKKNRTACKACRLRKCLMVGMSKSGSRYGRRSNWFKIHCLMQQVNGASSSPAAPSHPERNQCISPAITSPPTSLWRPLDVPSPPRSAHSEPMRPSSERLMRSPSHSPVQRTEYSPYSSRQITENKGHSAVVQSTPEIPISATMALGPRFPGLFSHFGGSLPFLPPTFNFPALASLPIHKQALLSPLLASSHMLAAAANARKAYPFFPAGLSSYENSSNQEDIFAEHKAFLERFRSTIHHHQAKSVSGDEERRSTASPIAMSPEPAATVSKPATPSPTASIRVIGQSNPMDLTKRSSTDERSSSSSSSSSMGSEIIPNLSDTDPEEDEETDASTRDLAQPSKRPEEAPLDLTCA